MSKRFKNKTCAYCARDGASTTADHVLAREFFPVRFRQDLPQVPSCARCNNDKSRLEHYLATVLPFGSRLPDAAVTLESLAPRRLRKNLRLARELSAGQEDFWRIANNTVTVQTTLPFDSETMSAYLCYVTRGLACFHFKIALPPGIFVGAGAFSPTADDMFATWLARRRGRVVQNELGNGIFHYAGIQATDNPGISVWQYAWFGGLELLDFDGPTVERIGHFWSISHSRPVPCLF